MKDVLRHSLRSFAQIQIQEPPSSKRFQPSQPQEELPTDNYIDEIHQPAVLAQPISTTVDEGSLDRPDNPTVAGEDLSKGTVVHCCATLFY